MKRLAIVILGLMMFSLCGCQTFTLTPEEFAAQQKGKADNSAESNAVAVGGTVGYFAAGFAQLFAK